MSSSRKRKLDLGQGTRTLSAAALKKRLLEAQAATTTATTSSENCEGSHKGPGGNENAGAGDKVSGGFEMLLLQGAQRSAGDDGLQTPEPLEEPPKRKVVPLSSFKPTKNNPKMTPNGVAVLNFSSGERLVILGSYGIRVKCGEASISGAILFPSQSIHWVHAPHCHALPVLRCSEQSVVELHNHQGESDLKNLERLSPVFGALWNEVSPGGSNSRKTYQILSSSADGPKRAFLQDLKSPAEWNKKIADIVKERRQRPPVVLVCGPKSSGKSTFSRLLVNRLVTDRGRNNEQTWPRVAILDVDPGQPEFTPPGIVSLIQLESPNLAPPFGHPTLTGVNSIPRSHALASVTPGSDLEHYGECVTDLYAFYLKSNLTYPLVINTPGWIQGSGLGLLMDIVSKVSPTEVVYMSEDGPEDTVEGLKSVCKGCTFTSLPSQSSEYTSRTALQLRHMQAMSYFHINPEQSSETVIRWDSKPLASQPPLVLNYCGSSSGILGVMCYGYQPEPELLIDSINGTIVAVVVIEDRRAFRTSMQAYEGVGSEEELGGPKVDEAEDLQSLTWRTPEQIPYIRCGAALRPEFSRCVGLALVRGVDVQRALIALVTPLSPSGLTGRDVVLVSGKFDIPTWAYTEEHYTRASQADGSQMDDGGVADEVVQGQEGRMGGIPWVESLHGGQKRVVGSKTWRVRRDLGRSSGVAGD